MHKTNKTIVIDDAVPFAKEMFSHLGEIISLPGRSINSETLKNADALVVRSRTQVNRDLLDHSKIEFVGSTVVGLDHVDQAYLFDQNIHFYSAQGCNANSVAEFVITSLFEMAEHFQFDLTQKTLGIIGVGNVGEKVYNKAQTLGIQCLLNDPPKVKANPNIKEQHKYVDLDECLTADIITFHTPLTKDGEFPTLHLLSAKRLQSITPEQIIINAARGGIIDESSWKQIKTKANVIDCWEDEPYIDDGLYKHAWIATPHTAGHSLDAKVAGTHMVYNALCQHWGVQVEDDWKKELPSSPSEMTIDTNSSNQAILNKLFNRTHNILNDDSVIRDIDIKEVHKKFEYYRRNFPIYREWHQHSVKQTDNPDLNNLLENLGFTVT